MSVHGSDSGSQPDMHLKPLDNAALLKPLRKAPDQPGAALFPAQRETAPAGAPSAVRKPPIIKMSPAAPKAPVYSDNGDTAPGTPKAPALKAPPAAPEAPEYDDDEDEDDVIVPGAPKAPAVKTPPAVPEAPEYDDEDEDDDDDLVPAPPEAPPVNKTPPVKEAPPVFDSGDEDADEYVPKAPAPAPRSATSYRPTDEQMHMMELMKRIFESALNAGLSAGQPPRMSPAEAPPEADDLRKILIALQQKIREAEIPVVIVIEGLSASGKGAMLTKLIEGLDSRGYKTHPIREPNCVEQAYPAMWRYWTKMPPKGNIALFCSSWYGELNKACFEHESEIVEFLPKRLNEIISMESQLICDGTLILKFFLHISQKEQYDRLKKREKKKATAWLVTDRDHEQNRRYDEYMKGMDDLMSITNLKGAPWHVLDAANQKSCAQQMIRTVIQAFEDALSERRHNLRPWDVPMLPNLSPIPSLGFPPLSTIDLNKRLDVPYDDAHKELKKRLNKLQIALYRRGIPMVICFEGWDAAGKGGAIRRLNAAMDARGFTVVPVSAPTPTELSHHYMWRFWTALPPKGHIAIFDRTWYGRVMVERIENLCTVPQWQRAYEEINRFEKLLTDDGAILCKFWLQIDPATQLERFQARKNDPEKQWKITDEDWRNREKWPAYEQAVDEVLQRTHTTYAPWTVIEADDKEYARIEVLRTVVGAMEKRLGGDGDDG
jgi:polyphosphate:AMP phosphotransferase